MSKLPLKPSQVRFQVVWFVFICYCKQTYWRHFSQPCPKLRSWAPLLGKDATVTPRNVQEVHHSYCHINLVKKTMYQWDIEKVGIYILYLPSDIHVQKYFEEPKKIFHLIFSFNSISKSRTTSNYIIRKLFSLWNTSQLVNCRINDKLARILVLQFYLKQFTTWNLQN